MSNTVPLLDMDVTWLHPCLTVGWYYLSMPYDGITYPCHNPDSGWANLCPLVTEDPGSTAYRKWFIGFKVMWRRHKRKCLRTNYNPKPGFKPEYHYQLIWFCIVIFRCIRSLRHHAVCIRAIFSADFTKPFCRNFHFVFIFICCMKSFQ